MATSNVSGYTVSCSVDGIKNTISATPGIVKWYTHRSFGDKYPNMEIERVIFDPPVTIIYFKDGSKIVVKCGEGEPFIEEVGFAMAFLRHYFDGSRSKYMKYVENAQRRNSKEFKEKKKSNKEKKDNENSI